MGREGGETVWVSSSELRADLLLTKGVSFRLDTVVYTFLEEVYEMNMISKPPRSNNSWPLRKRGGGGGRVVRFRSFDRLSDPSAAKETKRTFKGGRRETLKRTHNHIITQTLPYTTSTT